MKNKVLAVNNTSSEIQVILGGVEEDVDKIKIEDINIEMLSDELGATSTQEGEFIEDEESYSAADLIDQDQNRTSAAGGPGYGSPEDFAEETTPARNNEQILTGLFENIPYKKFDLSINISSNFIRTVNIKESFSEIKEKDKTEEVKRKLNKKLERPVKEEHFDYLVTADKNVLAFTYEGIPPFVNLYDRIREEIDAKTKIKSILPDEVALMNLVIYNYQPAPDEVNAIINIGRDNSRIIITKGEELLHISQKINIPSGARNLLNKISGRFLYEQDLHDITNFSKIIVTGMGKKEGAVEFLQDKFGTESEIEYFTLNEDKFIFPEDQEEDYSEIAPAIGLLVSQLVYDDQHKNSVDLIPEYIKDRQVFFKLTWYNVALLILLMLCPVYITYTYQQKQEAINKKKEKVAQVEKKLQGMRKVEQRQDSIQNELNNVMKELSRVKKLSSGAYRLSESLEKINTELEQIGKMWLSDMQYNRDRISLHGYSLYRSRIPRFLSTFADARMRNISPLKIRGATVYEFNLDIHEVIEDTTKFNPKVENEKINSSIGE